MITADVSSNEPEMSDTDRFAVTQLRDETPRLAAQLQTTAPWWTAPVSDGELWLVPAARRPLTVIRNAPSAALVS